MAFYVESQFNASFQNKGKMKEAEASLPPPLPLPPLSLINQVPLSGNARRTEGDLFQVKRRNVEDSLTDTTNLIDNIR